MNDSFSNREIEAPFNMAIATLKRLDLILIQIRQLHSQYTPDSNIKQKAHIDLVKQFYLNAIPLFDVEKEKEKEDGKKSMKELGKEILELNMERKSKISNGNQSVGEIYSYDKEIRLNEIMVDLQFRLKRFFMPGKKNVEGLM